MVPALVARAVMTSVAMTWAESSTTECSCFVVGLITNRTRGFPVASW